MPSPFETGTLSVRGGDQLREYTAKAVDEFTPLKDEGAHYQSTIRERQLELFNRTFTEAMKSYDEISSIDAKLTERLNVYDPSTIQVLTPEDRAELDASLANLRTAFADHERRSRELKRVFSAVVSWLVKHDKEIVPVRNAALRKFLDAWVEFDQNYSSAGEALLVKYKRAEEGRDMERVATALSAEQTDGLDASLAALREAREESQRYFSTILRTFEQDWEAVKDLEGKSK